MRALLGALLPIAIIVTVTIGCEGMQFKKTTRVGDKVTVESDEKTAAQDAKRDEAKAARMKEIQAAPKRKPTDIIVVALLEPTIGGGMDKDTAKRMHEYLRKEFENDPIIKLGNQMTADVSIRTTVGFKKVYGIDRRTKKPAQGSNIEIKGDAISMWLGDTTPASAEGNVFKNVEVLKNYATQIKTGIKNNLGPNLPAKSANLKSPAQMSLKSLFGQ